MKFNRAIEICSLLILNYAALLIDAQLFNEYPNSAVCVLTNAIRYDMGGYQSYFSNRGNGQFQFGCSSTGSLNSLYPSDGLTSASQVHSVDQANFNQMTHDTLDPNLISSYGGRVDFAARIGAYYKASSVVAENVANGYSQFNPIEVVNAWAMSAGHCVNMVGSYDRHGYSSVRTGNTFMTQTFGYEGTRPSNAIACGSHLATGGNDAEFIVAVDSGAVSRVDVIVGNQRIQMQTVVGHSQKGVYSAKSSVSSGCTDYQFQAYDGSGQVIGTYPQSGSLQTAAVGSCPANAGATGNQVNAPNSPPAAGGAPKTSTPSTPSTQQNGGGDSKPVVLDAPSGQPQAPRPPSDNKAEQVLNAPGAPSQNKAPPQSNSSFPRPPTNFTNQFPEQYYSAPSPNDKVGNAASTVQFQTNSIDLKNPSTVSGIVVPCIIVAAVVAAMAIYVARNVKQGQKWNDPETFRRDGATLVRTLTRGGGRGTSRPKQLLRQNSSHLDGASFPRVAVYKTPSMLSRVSSDSPLNSPIDSVFPMPTPAILGDETDSRFNY
ncbi:hypothetical protein MIR68_000647 [Amoeboaphelidium protococcarum]|nr:hypothetical protein MIR68_000647 [Amoeboaphelidium protococcarum]